MAARPPREARSYGDGCAAAHALDVVGERWALLVVRELLFGPRRFSDLRAALPGISPTVLTQRLKELEAGGVVVREHLPPPAASWVYALTPWGQELDAVLWQLTRWGVGSPALPRGAPISTATGLSALKTMFSAGRAGGLDLTLALTVGGEPFTARIAGGEFHLERGAPPHADAGLSGAVGDLRDVIFGGLPLEVAQAQGTVSVTGDPALAARFVTLFPLPGGGEGE